MIARIVVGFVVVAVLGWLVVGLRGARLEAEGARLMGDSPGRASAGKLADARVAYLRAAELTPDTEPEYRAAAAANFSGHRREALRLLRDVVRREPENFDAWIVLIGVAKGLDPALSARAVERVRALNPLQFGRPG